MFKYDNQEWDNVPSVIPKYLIHLEQFIHIQSREHEKLETTQHLRAEMEERLGEVNDKAEEARGID